MKFFIDDVLIYFPYSYIYPEQYQYMVKLKAALDAGKGVCMLEMPSGTGKTVSLLSLITSYQLAHPEVGKLIYCSRTVPEIEKTMEEARRVMAYREKELGESNPKTLCLALSSRRNLCIHPRVSEQRDSIIVDSLCHKLTASWTREKHKADSSVEVCNFYEAFDKQGKNSMLYGVFSFEDLREYGLNRGWCPYFLARHAINYADVIIFSYQYIIDPKISELVSKEFKQNCIIVFDEAHNIDNVCIDALSAHITKRILEMSSENLRMLSISIKKSKETDAQRLKQEYDKLLEGLAKDTFPSNIADRLKGEPVLSEDIINEVVPGNIRRGEHFVGLLKRLIVFLKNRLRIHQPLLESPSLFLQGLYQLTQIEPRMLRFCASRLTSLLLALEISDIDRYYPLSVISDFATLVGTYTKGFMIVIEPSDNHTDPFLQLCCLDSSLALRPIVERFRSIVITSGTLSPLEYYAKILDIKPILVDRLGISFGRNCICPLIVSRGNDQAPIETEKQELSSNVITSKFESRSDTSVIRNLGNLIIDLSAIVPDGIVCFFTSYSYMEEVLLQWSDMNVLNKISQNKLIFAEVPDTLETAQALEYYKKACDCGRGAILFSVARGKVSEGIDFDHHYGRCVILCGIPYINTQSRILRARLEFLRENSQIRESDFLAFDAMRTAAQCVGRVIRGKTDYGIMVFADKRYAHRDKYKKLPQWIEAALQRGNMNLSIDMAVSIARVFLKEMAQPWNREEQLGRSLWTADHIRQLQQPTQFQAPKGSLQVSTVPPSF